MKPNVFMLYCMILLSSDCFPGSTNISLHDAHAIPTNFIGQVRLHPQSLLKNL